MHKKFFNNIAKKHFEEQLKPSCSLASLYDVGKGNCSYHIDRPPCYRTIDLCVNQVRPWSIYVTHEHTDLDIPKQDYFTKKDFFLDHGVEYILEPGDALFYSGTQFPHWRSKMEEDNFCHMVLFHFVPEDYMGELS